MVWAGSGGAIDSGCSFAVDPAGRSLFSVTSIAGAGGGTTAASLLANRASK